MDKPAVSPACADRLLATERAIQQAAADAAWALSTARNSRRIAAASGDDAALTAAQLDLARTRRALVGACWRADARRGPYARFRSADEIAAERRILHRFSWRSTAVS